MLPLLPVVVSEEDADQVADLDPRLIAAPVPATTPGGNPGSDPLRPGRPPLGLLPPAVPAPTAAATIPQMDLLLTDTTMSPIPLPSLHQLKGEFQQSLPSKVQVTLSQPFGKDNINQSFTADVRLRSGHRDRREGSKGEPVEQDVGTRSAVRLDKALKSRGRHCTLGRNLEIDLDQHRGSANAHRRGRGIDLHVAVFCGCAGDE